MTRVAWNLTFLCAVGLIFFLLRGRLKKPLLLSAYGVIACLSFVNYVSDLNKPVFEIFRDAKESVTSRVDPYDLTFYYLNTKYFSEIGYFDLYSLLLKTSYDKKIQPFHFRTDKALLQNREGFYWKDYDEILKDTDSFEKIRARFTEKRWKEFLDDTFYLLRTKREGWNPRRWTNFFWDHGFNATPGWLAVVKPIVSVVPVEWVKLLCFGDAVLLYGALIALGFCWGAEFALIALIVLWNSLSTEWPDIGDVMGRYDYVAFIFASVIFSVRRREAWSGVCFGVASAFRYIPIIGLTILFAQWIVHWKNGRNVVDLKGFAKGFTASFLSLHLLAMITLPSGSFTDFYYKMGSHAATENLTRGKVGIKLALTWDGALDQQQISEERKQTIEDRKPYFLVTAVLLSVGFIIASLNTPLFLQLSLFPILVFVWSMPSYHYFVIFLVPLVVSLRMGIERNFWYLLGGALLLSECVARFMQFRYDASVTTTSAWCVSYSVATLIVALFGYKRSVQCRLEA